MYNPPKRNKKLNLSVTAEVYDLLKRMSIAETRSMSEQVSHMILERSRSLDPPGKISEEIG